MQPPSDFGEVELLEIPQRDRRPLILGQLCQSLKQQLDAFLLERFAAGRRAGVRGRSSRSAGPAQLVQAR